MNRRPFLLVLTALVVSLALVSGTALAQTPKRGGTLRVSYGNEIANLDFHTAPGYEMMWVAMNVGCGLVNITPDGKFVGDAADSWQVSADNLTYTFKLRPNVLFHDGTKVDATAVKFSIDRLMDPATKSGMRTFYDLGALGRGARSADRAGADEAALRVLPAHAGRLPDRPRPLLADRHPEVQPGRPQAGQAGGGGGLRPVPPDRMGEGRPPGDGALRQVLRAGAARISIASSSAPSRTR